MPLLIDGSPAESETELSPEAENGCATVSFEFNGTDLEWAHIVNNSFHHIH